jgi:hypothetical protein
VIIPCVDALAENPALYQDTSSTSPVGHEINHTRNDASYSKVDHIRNIPLEAYKCTMEEHIKIRYQMLTACLVKLLCLWKFYVGAVTNMLIS